MQWDEQDVAGLAAAVTKANPAWVLWFNEPDHKQQANVTPEETARRESPRGFVVNLGLYTDMPPRLVWKLYAQPLRAKGYKVASPAFTNSGAADEGIKWMERFVAACTNCTWDVTGVFGETASPKLCSLLDSYPLVRRLDRRFEGAH